MNDVEAATCAIEALIDTEPVDVTGYALHLDAVASVIDGSGLPVADRHALHDRLRRRTAPTIS